MEDRKQRLLAHLRAIAPDKDLGSLAGIAAARNGMLPSGAADGTEEVAIEAPPVLKSAAERLLSDHERLTGPELDALEAIILPAERPVVDVRQGTYAAPDWSGGLLGRAEVREHVEKALPAVGRVELAPEFALPFGGTAFIVGDGLMMTNRHVAGLFARGVGRGALVYRPGSAGVDLLCEIDTTEAHLLDVTGVRMIHPWWDMALLTVSGNLSGISPLELSDIPPAEADGRPIAVLGYPALDGRNDLDVQRKVFGNRFNVKRIMPGLSRREREVASFEQRVMALCHDASTLGGASGSAVLDLTTGAVLGLHFAGVYLDSNFCVPTRSLLADPRVRDAGVRGPAVTAPALVPWEDRWREIETEGPRSTGRGPDPAPQVTTVVADAGGAPPSGSVTVEFPLRVTVSLGAPAVVTASIAPLRPPSPPPPWEPSEGLSDSEHLALRAAFSEIAGTPHAGFQAAVEAPGSALPRSAVRLVTDAESPCLRHIGAPFSDQPFTLDGAALERLARLNGFTDGLAEWGGDLVLIGLRGCRLVGDPDAFAPARDLQDRLGFATDAERIPPARLPLWYATNGFVRQASLVEDTVTHVLPRCLVGVWRRSTGEVALMRGTTAPNWDYTGLAIAARRGNDDAPGDANMLLTGLYRYRVGNHKDIPDAFRLQNQDHGAIRVASMGKNEICYTVRDRYWHKPSWPSQDNLHPSMAGPGSAQNYVFHYSAGCTTVQGRYDEGRRRHEGAWSVLRGWAGLSRESVDEAAIGKRDFSYMLLTGREARLAAQGAPDAAMARLRYGSRGASVGALQRALATATGKPLSETRHFDGATQERLVSWQWTRGLNRESWDAVLGPAEAAMLGVTLV